MAACLPAKIAAALPMMEPQRMMPCPPRPPTRISVLSTLASVRLESVAECVTEVIIHRLEPRGALAVDELADDDLPVEGQADFFGVGAVFDQAVLLVVLELVDSVAALVASGIERRAGGKRLDEDKALLLESLLHCLGQLTDVENSPSRHINGSAGIGEKRQVERLLEIAERHGRLLGTDGRGRGDLATGHAVGEIVHTDHHQIHVPPGGVHEVIAADGSQIPIAGVNDDLQFWIGQFEASGKGNGPAVGGVKGIDVQIAGYAAGAADARDHRHLIEIDARLGQGAGKAIDRRTDAARGTPNVRDALLAQEWHHRIARLDLAEERLNGDRTVHDAASTMT